MATCPNKNLDSWKNLVISRGETLAYFLWDKYNGEVPESESRESIVKSGLKSISILQGEKAKQLFSTLSKNKVIGETFWKKLQNDLFIPKEQIEILKSFNTYDREELLTNLLANYSYSVEINTAIQPTILQQDDGAGGLIKIKNSEGVPTKHYSNLTVPGGTNYTENRIITPKIVPSIKGHPQFAENNDIGWFRSDETSDTSETFEEFYKKQLEKYPDNNLTEDQLRYAYDDRTNFKRSKNLIKIRRILEIQSDLFQKGRDIKSPDEIIQELQKSGKLEIKCD